MTSKNELLRKVLKMRVDVNLGTPLFANWQAVRSYSSGYRMNAVNKVYKCSCNCGLASQLDGRCSRCRKFGLRHPLAALIVVNELLPYPHRCNPEVDYRAQWIRLYEELTEVECSVFTKGAWWVNWPEGYKGLED